MVTSIAPYGEWVSPISAADVATGGVSLSYPQLVRSDGGDLEVWWSEGRPTEGGRLAVVRRGAEGIADVLPAPWNARTRVHEYGGLSWLVIAAGLVFCEFTDQRLWLLPSAGGAPIPLTPEPAEPAGLRYAELTLVGDEVWCIRERHRPGTANPVDRMFVAVATDGSLAVRDLIGGSDFLYGPQNQSGRAPAGLARLEPPADAVGRHRASSRRDHRVGRRAHGGGADDDIWEARPRRFSRPSGLTPSTCTRSPTAAAGGI